MTKVDTLISYGMTEIGKPYVYGNEGPNSFDCSGLMQWIFNHVGISLPRTAREQQRFASPVSTPAPGDLVFYNTPATHVGLYLGGGKMLHAPNSRSKVKVASVYGSPTYGRVSGLGAGGLTAQNVGLGISNGISNMGFDVGGFLGVLRQGAVSLTIVAGAIVLIGLGAWQATKGET